MTSILKADNIQDADGNNIINESGNTITIGASGDTISIPSGATIANSGTATGFGGITMADQWRMTSNVTSNQSPITSVEQVDNTGQGTLGSAMSVSSGIFTFPQTGIYRVTFSAYGATSGSDNVGLELYVTTDNTNYTNTAQCYDGNDSSHSISMYCETLVDVTDTSLVKVRFDIASITSATVYGSTSLNNTVMTFISLGDT
jgi:hypothetical protein